MDPSSLRILIGFVVMVVTCSASYVLGDRPVRKVALLIAFVSMATVLVQLATGLRAEPAIAADVISSLVILRWAWTGGRVWLWVMVGGASCLLLLHALLFTVAWVSVPLETVLNNILVFAGQMVMVTAAVQARRVRA